MVNFILFFTYTIMEMDTVALSNPWTVSWTTISFSSSARGQSWQNMARTGNKKCSVSWNLPTPSQLWQCNGDFRPCTTQNHLQTKQFVSGTWNYSRVAAVRCKMNRMAGAIGWDFQARTRNVFQVLNMSPRVDISSTCKVGQKLWRPLPLSTCSSSAWPSRLLYCRGRKSRRDLWTTLYMCVCMYIVSKSLQQNEGNLPVVP
jgi:hypothetical protein